MTTLPDVLGLDTNAFIYLLEGAAQPRARFLEDELLRPMTEGRLQAITSAVSLAEMLVPTLKAGDVLEAAEIHAALTGLPGLRILSIDEHLAELAASVRARSGFKLLDAFQVAAALEGRAQAFLTNDTRLIRDGLGIRMILLDDAVREWQARSAVDSES